MADSQSVLLRSGAPYKSTATYTLSVMSSPLPPVF